jgi:hypothetical protein
MRNATTPERAPRFGNPSLWNEPIEQHVEVRDAGLVFLKDRDELNRLPYFRFR